MKTTNNSLKIHGLFSIAFVSLFLLLNSCSSSSNEPPANQVYIKGMAFTPATLTVVAGTTVKWTNKDGVAHTVTSDTGVFDSGNVAANGTYSYMFMTAGTYTYTCLIHPTMKGKIIVTAASSMSGTGY